PTSQTISSRITVVRHTLIPTCTMRSVSECSRGLPVLPKRLRFRPFSSTGFVRAETPFRIGFSTDTSPRTEKQRKKDVQGEGNDPSKLAITFQQARFTDMRAQGGGATLTGAPVTTD